MVEAKPLEPHDVHSERLMRHAYEQLEKGDRLQASEKAWGAVAHRLKVVAAVRGIPYNTHRDVYLLQRNLLDGAADPEQLELLFANADSLHKNYYIDSISPDALRTRLNNARKLLDILEGPEYSGGNGVVVPRDPTPSNDDPAMEVVPQPSLRSDAVVDVVVEDEPVARISVESHPDRSTAPVRLMTPSRKRRRQSGSAYLRRGERNRKRKR